jgi:membrane associated rhomboid family serine protease
MSNYGYEPRGRTFFSGAGLSSAVKLLLAWNVILFLIQQMTQARLGPWMSEVFGLVPVLVWRGWVWQLVTYMFLHGGFIHIIFNMLALWMFGSELEYLWGTRRFLRFYFFTGIGAAITTVLVTPHSPVPTIGASGAIYGLLLAYGVTFPDRPILLYFLFPIRAKYFVILFGIIELLAPFTSPHSGIAHFAHLGGILFGWLYLKGFPGQRALRNWQRRRQLRKFTVVDFRDQDDWNRR